MSDRKLEHTLSPSYPKIKIISDTVMNFIGLIIVGVLFWLDHYFAWPTWASWIVIAVLVFTIVGTIWSFIEPIYHYRSWSYQYDEEYLQLSYGIFKKMWVTVPMTKIQSVATVQGPIMKRFNTRSIKVETMGSSHTIPAIEEDVALALREELMELAKLKEVDE